ncbi:hypothetical protein [Enterobacter bugandensis]|uniref:hypothetical protein n=1 Tax=Enterobacter bugandensis TaxID=881260 RepID=UPI00069C959B|nr:hypothetical protein [Enterobacter bugandensis]
MHLLTRGNVTIDVNEGKDWLEFTRRHNLPLCPLEAVEQKETNTYLRYFHPEILAFHPVNESGAAGDEKYGAELKKRGRLTGISDWVILEPRGGHPYALIELKRNLKSKSRLTPDQKEVLLAAKKRGAWTAVAWGCDAFEAALEMYLAL